MVEDTSYSTALDLFQDHMAKLQVNKVSQTNDSVYMIIFNSIYDYISAIIDPYLQASPQPSRASPEA